MLRWGLIPHWAKEEKIGNKLINARSETAAVKPSFKNSLRQKNEFNLNLPRYIDSRTTEDLQDIAGHLQGGIPVRDVDALKRYWEVCPQLRQHLFKDNRPGYLTLAVEKAAIKLYMARWTASARL